MLLDRDTVLSTSGQDSLAFTKSVLKLLNDWTSEGFIYSGIDSITVFEDTVSWYAHQGDRFQWDQIHIQSEDSSISYDVKSSPNKVLTKYADSGYPFSRLFCQELSTNGDEITATFMIDMGPQISFDSVQIQGELSIRQGPLHKILGVQPGAFYQESVFKGIKARVESVPFIALKTEPDIGFSDQKATVYLEVESVKAGRFDGIVGLVPSPPGSDRSSQLNGFFDLALPNLFNAAIDFNAYWSAFGANSQKIALSSSAPHLTTLGLGIEAAFDLIRQDTTFLNQSFRVSLLSRIGTRSKISFGYRRQNSIEQGSFSELIRPFQYAWYQFSYRSNTPLFAFERSSGFSYQFDASVGDRRLLEEEVNRRSLSLQSTGRLSLSQKIFNKALFYTSSSAGLLINEQGLVNNELYRIGGTNSVRGFIENELFASSYFYQNIEFRQYIDQGSYLWLFTDQGAYRNLEKSTRFLSSAGIGLALRTDAGRFNLIFATGTEWNNIAPSFTSLVHFGYSATF